MNQLLPARNNPVSTISNVFEIGTRKDSRMTCGVNDNSGGKLFTGINNTGLCYKGHQHGVTGHTAFQD
jgi:hypothetical protein